MTVIQRFTSNIHFVSFIKHSYGQKHIVTLQVSTTPVNVILMCSLHYVNSFTIKRELINTIKIQNVIKHEKMGKKIYMKDISNVLKNLPLSKTLKYNKTKF